VAAPLLSRASWLTRLELLDIAFTYTPDPCGSGLAREGAGTSNIVVNRALAIASKPPPTLVLQ
jgi:hypothetical protein